MDTIVIGIDGGEWDVINRMIENDELPNLASLKETGVSGPLESITPPVSPPAWNSIQTGTNPGKHGIFDFSTFDEEHTRRSINAADRQATPFWRVMNDEGVTTGLFKVPFTYPPDEVSGYVVTGFPTPNTVNDFAKPNALTDEVGPVEDLFEDWGLQQAGDYEAFKQNLLAVAECQTDLFVDLLDEYDTDLSMTVYDGSDRIQHFFWKYFDEDHPRYEPGSPFEGAIEEYYRTVDQGIGRIRENLDDTHDVIVLSDHGFGSLSYDIYIDEWLDNEGFLSRSAEGRPQQRAENLLASTLRVTWDAFQKVGIAETVKSVLPASWYQSGIQVLDDTHQDIIWSETKAFFTTLSGQALYVHLEDRFVDGTVSRADYDTVVAGIEESLLSIQHPKTGEQLVEEVIRSDEEFDGWALEYAPDLIVRTKPKYTLKGGRSDSLLQSSAQNGHDRTGDHRTDGMLIASGPSFAQGTYDDASVLDIAPTLLSLQDCPVPTSVDGAVLKEIFAADIQAEMDITECDDYGRTTTDGRQWNVEEEQELENRLSDMGYL